VIGKRVDEIEIEIEKERRRTCSEVLAKCQETFSQF
jgi:hypothetical protein